MTQTQLTDPLQSVVPVALSQFQGSFRITSTRDSSLDVGTPVTIDTDTYIDTVEIMFGERGEEGTWSATFDAATGTLRGSLGDRAKFHLSLLRAVDFTERGRRRLACYYHHPSVDRPFDEAASWEADEDGG